MANPEIVGTLSHEFYKLREAGAVLSHGHLPRDDWAALCAWVDSPEDITTIPLYWPVGCKRAQLHMVRYHRDGAVGVD